MCCSFRVVEFRSVQGNAARNGAAMGEIQLLETARPGQIFSAADFFARLWHRSVSPDRSGKSPADHVLFIALAM
jgi:hypothetical protein